MCVCVCVCVYVDAICSVFASVFTITEFALQYNAPNDVIGADAKDRTKVELLAATPSTPRTAPIALPPQPQISVHRRSSCAFNHLPQKPTCPGFKALTVSEGEDEDEGEDEGV